MFIKHWKPTQRFHHADYHFVFTIFFNFETYFSSYWTNTRHICTYLNAFLTAIPNIVTKLLSIWCICKKCNILDLWSAHACRMLRVQTSLFLSMYAVLPIPRLNRGIGLLLTLFWPRKTAKNGSAAVWRKISYTYLYGLWSGAAVWDVNAPRFGEIFVGNTGIMVKYVCHYPFEP